MNTQSEGTLLSYEMALTTEPWWIRGKVWLKAPLMVSSEQSIGGVLVVRIWKPISDKARILQCFNCGLKCQETMCNTAYQMNNPEQLLLVTKKKETG